MRQHAVAVVGQQFSPVNVEPTVALLGLLPLDHATNDFLSKLFLANLDEFTVEGSTLFGWDPRNLVGFAFQEVQNLERRDNYSGFSKNSQLQRTSGRF